MADHRAHSELRLGLATGRAVEFLVARLRAPLLSSSPTTHPHQPTVPEPTCDVRRASFEAIWSGPNSTDRKTEFQRIKKITQSLRDRARMAKLPLCVPPMPGTCVHWSRALAALSYAVVAISQIRGRGLVFEVTQLVRSGTWGQTRPPASLSVLLTTPRSHA